LESFHPVILDVIDLDMEFYRSRTNAYFLPWWERIGARFHLMQLEKIVPPLMQRFDAVWFANPADQKALGVRKGRVLPNIPFPQKGLSTEPIPPADDSNKTLLTVGTLSYQPNKDGIDLFLKESWPVILNQAPDARFLIVGSGLSEKQRGLWQKHHNVEVRGFVDDLSKAYESCAFAVAPIFWGAGTNIKVLESLAYGRTSVITRFAHRGFEDTLKHMESLVVANDTKDLAESCLRLLREPGLRNRLAISGHQKIRQSYSFEYFCQIVRATLDNVLTHEEI
jgi:glycosyltransferase involved in cell wall biosynthesis